MKHFYLTTILLLLLCTSAMAGVVRLAWDHEGAGHLGFRLYYGSTSHAAVMEPLNPVAEHAAGVVVSGVDPAPYENVVDIADPGARFYEMTLPNGFYYFRMVTIGQRQDSAFTAEEAMAYVGLNPPEGFRVEWILIKPQSEGK